MIHPQYIYFGFNSFDSHKRGVENVIHFQSFSNQSNYSYYLHWDDRKSVRKKGSFISVGINKNIFRFLFLNLIITAIKNKHRRIFIHSHNPLMSVFCVYRTNLLTVHDGLYYLSRQYKSKACFLFALLEKFLYTRCNYIHFISKFSKLKSLYDHKPDSCIIPNTSHFERMMSIEPKHRNKTNLFPKDRFKILIVRSIEERALIDLIIDAASSLRSEKFHFLIAGKGPLLEQKRKKIAQLNLTNICLLGYVSDADIINLYRSCDLVITPAAYGEGFGLPIIEAYLFNKPVIASNVCAIPEVIVSQDYLFDNNVKSLVTKINYVKGLEKSSYKSYYDSRFSNTHVVSELRKLYEKLS